jgi:eukaryotic-like serine/threonine-protein kinase
MMQFPTSISPDGTRLFLFGGPVTSLNMAPVGLSVLSMGASTSHQTGQLRPEAILQSPAAQENGEISPDGRWLAYQSIESGQFQVYVRPFPAVDSGRWSISPAGGTRPAWARNGRELFYLDGNDQLTSVPVETKATTFGAGTPTRILDTKYYAGATTAGFDLRAYDVSRDGQRFLMIKDTPSGDQKPDAPPASMVVVLNWTEELKARVPASK